MASTIPSDNIKKQMDENISSKLISEIIRDRIKSQNIDLMQTTIYQIL